MLKPNQVQHLTEAREHLGKVGKDGLSIDQRTAVRDCRETINILVADKNLTLDEERDKWMAA